MSRLRRLLPRFSLRTLVVFLLLVTSGMGLWWRWEPWYVCQERDILGNVGHGSTRNAGGDCTVSADGSRAIESADRQIIVLDASRTPPEPIATVDCGWGPLFAGISADGAEIQATSIDMREYVYRRRRPERWWGVFWLWEFWLTAAFAGLFIWSVIADRRRLAAER